MIKERIMLIVSILLLLLSGCLSVYATTTISTSKEIDYNSKNSKIKLKSDNVQDAIDELDNICETRCPEGFTCTKN